MTPEIMRKLLVAGAAVAALARREGLGQTPPAETDSTGPQRSEVSQQAPDGPLNSSGRDQ